MFCFAYSYMFIYTDIFNKVWNSDSSLQNRGMTKLQDQDVIYKLKINEIGQRRIYLFKS